MRTGILASRCASTARARAAVTHPDAIPTARAARARRPRQWPCAPARWSSSPPAWCSRSPPRRTARTPRSRRSPFRTRRGGPALASLTLSLFLSPPCKRPPHFIPNAPRAQVRGARDVEQGQLMPAVLRVHEDGLYRLQDGGEERKDGFGTDGHVPEGCSPGPSRRPRPRVPL